MEGEAVKLDADVVAHPFIGGKRIVGHHAREVRMREAAARLQHVGVKAVGGVVRDARCLLQVGARRGNAAAAKKRVAAEDRHLFNEDHVRARVLCFNGGAEPRIARAHDEHVAGLRPRDVAVELFFLRACSARAQKERACAGGADCLSS